MNKNYEFFMKTALNLARKGVGMVSPNPPVGAVLVKYGKIIGWGYHKKFGGPHAEVFALKNFEKKDLEGAILFVTLEPCAHYGKTPPCTKLIVEKGIKKVVIGVRDKNPLVSGKGVEQLKKNGVDVVEGILKDELERFYAPFFKFITEKIPFITLKFAQTFDGKNRAKKGEKYLVSDKTLRYVHKLRYESDAILVSANTVLTDNPFLDIRHYYKKKDLLKIVLDTNGRLTGNENIFKSRGEVIVYTGNNELLNKNISAKIVVLDKDMGRLNLKNVLKDLGLMKVQNLLVEGGGRLSFELIHKNLIDKLIIILCPYILGGEDNLAVSGYGFETLKDAFYLENYNVKKIDRDLVITWSKY